MAQFDVYRLSRATGLVVDCRADLLRTLATRLIVPLVTAEEGAMIVPRLNPRFVMNGSAFLFTPQLAASISSTLLRDPIGSLAAHDLAVKSAIDLLLTSI